MMTRRTAVAGGDPRADDQVGSGTSACMSSGISESTTNGFTFGPPA
jgi:hypothetical protein